MHQQGYTGADMEAVSNVKPAQRFTGIERWKPEFFAHDYVKVLDMFPAGTCYIQSTQDGKKTKADLYLFRILVNYTRGASDENSSTVFFKEVNIAVTGMDINDPVDYMRVRRRFECSAMKIIHNTKAKHPRWEKKFQTIDLRKNTWSYLFPGVTSPDPDPEP